jgi:16S rRNA (guanine966-N2)-methyltransferase
VLTFLGSANLLAENAVVIAEHQRSLDLPETFGKLERVRVLRQGDAALSFFRFRSPSLPESPRSE